MTNVEPDDTDTRARAAVLAEIDARPAAVAPGTCAR